MTSDIPTTNQAALVRTIYKHIIASGSYHFAPIWTGLRNAQVPLT